MTAAPTSSRHMTSPIACGDRPRAAPLRSSSVDAANTRRQPALTRRPWAWKMQPISRVKLKNNGLVLQALLLIERFFLSV